MDIFALYSLATKEDKETFQDSPNALERLIRKIKIASTLFIVYMVLLSIFHIINTVAIAFMVPTLKPLHAIGYFFFGTIWLAPMLIYYVLANGFTLTAPRQSVTTFNNRRL